MKTTTTLRHALLTAAMLCAGCDLIDLGDDDDDKDPEGETTGDGETGSEDGGSASASAGPTSAGGSQGSGADGSSGGAGEEDTSTPADSSGGGEGEVTGGVACEPDTQACIDEATIGVCIDGEVVLLDCNDACIEIGGTAAIGCFFDEEAGVDLCFCDDGSGGSGGA
ncbi:MAG: hypothetical protein JNK45_10375 [Myxococcales bacterium]|nr:hypothetical protein [Myxococcales bacterium]